VVYIVLMLVMLVMDVCMGVRHRLMDMFMLMAFREVQPNAKSHKATCQH
jgi:hypothetical protein